MELVDEDCQTEEPNTHSREIQVDFSPQTCEMSIDAQEDLLEKMKTEIENKLKEEFERKQKLQKRLSIALPMDSSGGPPTE